MQQQGILVPIVTPFDRDGRLDLAALRQLVERFIEQGVAGIVACGTTGEYYALDEDERRQVLECVAKAGKGRLRLIAGANDLSTRGAIARARQAAELGYEALMLAPPAYSLPDQAGIVAHFKAVAAASALPIILYNFPARAGVSIDIASVIELSRDPNIVGIKESSGDFSRALALIQARLPDFEVICGCDDQAADFLFWGVRSWISGAANVFPGEQAAMLNAAKAEDWTRVRTLMAAMYPAIQAMESGGYNQKAKLGVRRHGVDAGDVRLPLLPLPNAEAKAFLDALAAFDR
ncbi:4-hydroxy-tetrahydrodipicolinate synthase [Chromobacterium alkanivorans]|uniref:4-hydroxy-tetrahydrodipicolinate synthase n=1 Tax=Chromobacterium alkanivorans TaxID=1071719 RepID=UPI002167E3C5|nr:4-hydroxy-tetrahydrodipicolinate synthase [Chromobacterium alkanivorans]MCS3804274.1 4-hydroxy-tetrahydrodipicolinate synthase [Chromobacterium alkanivorans]MCS3818506.1 4-hydroxy-tetrahydrodipicolinate synthase [Chromobacterium alkanivorans]MCS3873559.1 4-hydroxy-tetrahydrodipicolinate synthase [Chromobacterium alkanivorans]